MICFMLHTKKQPVRLALSACQSGKYLQSGFTLVELMVTLLVSAVLLGIAVPSFTQLIKNNQIVSETNTFIGAFSFARTEAIRRGGAVYVTASNSAGVANEWGPALRVWYDTDNDGIYDVGEELRLIESSSSVTIDSDNDAVEIVFSNQGMPSTSEIFWVCDNRTGESGRKISLLGGGAIKVDLNTCT